jgi:hypothetical protein
LVIDENDIKKWFYFFPLSHQRGKKFLTTVVPYASKVYTILCDL